MMELLITDNGVVHCLYDEALDLHQLGPLHIGRASHVEPDAEGRWWADLAPIAGPRLGPFARRSEALAAVRRYLGHNLHRLKKTPGDERSSCSLSL